VTVTELPELLANVTVNDFEVSSPAVASETGVKAIGLALEIAVMARAADTVNFSVKDVLPPALLAVIV
jgi:hypothetical protein